MTTSLSEAFARLVEQRSAALDYISDSDIPEPARTRLLVLLDDGRRGGPLCGKTTSSTGTTYPPCARPAGHHEAYCRDRDRTSHFIAQEDQ